MTGVEAAMRQVSALGLGLVLGVRMLRAARRGGRLERARRAAGRFRGRPGSPAESGESIGVDGILPEKRCPFNRNGRALADGRVVVSYDFPGALLLRVPTVRKRGSAAPK